MTHSKRLARLVVLAVLLIPLAALGAAGCKASRTTAPGAGGEEQLAPDSSAGASSDSSEDAGTGAELADAAGSETAGPVELVNLSPSVLAAVGVAGDWVYYSGQGFVWRVPKQGGDSEQVAPWDGYPWPQFAVTEAHVCWPDAGNIACQARDSGEEMTSIDLDGQVSSIAFLGTDGSELYFAQAGCLRMARLTASHELVWVVDGPTGYTLGGGWVTGDAQSIYCITEGALFRFERSDGTASVLADGFDDGGPIGLSDADVFWIHGNRVRPPQMIEAISKTDAGAEPRRVTSVDGVGGSGLIVDEQHGRLYWTSFDTVMSAPMAGGEATEVWADTVQIRSIASDGSYLYWVASGTADQGKEGRLMKLKKPDT